MLLDLGELVPQGFKNVVPRRDALQGCDFGHRILEDEGGPLLGLGKGDRLHVLLRHGARDLQVGHVPKDGPVGQVGLAGGAGKGRLLVQGSVRQLLRQRQLLLGLDKGTVLHLRVVAGLLFRKGGVRVVPFHLPNLRVVHVKGPKFGLGRAKGLLFDPNVHLRTFQLFVKLRFLVRRVVHRPGGRVAAHVVVLVQRPCSCSGACRVREQKGHAKGKEKDKDGPSQRCTLSCHR